MNQAICNTGKKLYQQTFFLSKVFINVNPYVNIYVPASNIVINATIVVRASAGFFQFTIPIAATCISVPIHDSAESSKGGVKIVKIKMMRSFCLVIYHLKLRKRESRFKRFQVHLAEFFRHGFLYRF